MINRAQCNTTRNNKLDQAKTQASLRSYQQNFWKEKRRRYNKGHIGYHNLSHLLTLQCYK